MAIGLGGCSKTPAAPDPVAVVTPPPPAEAPSLTCGAAINVRARTSAGMVVTYPEPERKGGQGDVTVTCSPESGATFAVGATTVECKATDTLNRTATCDFQVAVDPPYRLRRTRIMAFGDSLTEGQSVVPGTDNVVLQANPEVAYPAVLSRLLSERYTDQTITVTNRGKGGEPAFHGLGRFIEVFRADLPDVVIILEGSNDLYRGQGASAVAEAEGGVSELASEARNRGARVFICALPPTKPGRRNIPLSTIVATNDRLRVVARGEGAYFIDTLTPLLADLDGNVDSDGLHLTPLGYKRLADVVFAAIKADLEIQ